MHESEIKEVKERYGIDLRTIDYKKLSVVEITVLGHQISELQRKLMNDHIHEDIISPAFDSMRAYKIKRDLEDKV